MKNKKFTYLLLAAVAVLWSMIGYRVYKSMAADDEKVYASRPIKKAYFKMINHISDSVTLLLNYKDPFSKRLNEIEVQGMVVSTVDKDPQAVKTNIKKLVRWETIRFTGYINNKDNRKKVAILSLDGKEFMLSEGQTANGVKLLRYTTDSIKLQFEQETRYVKLK